jgi:hypothetical protein
MSLRSSIPTKNHCLSKLGSSFAFRIAADISLHRNLILFKRGGLRHMKKRLALLLALTTIASMGAEVRTTNFIVIAANPQVCERVGQWAEYYRKEKAVQWLGHEMPNWPEPCPLKVTVSMESPSGATTFTFGYGRVTSIQMQIQGPLDRLIYSVLPHEVTHTVFAHHFKRPVPRWADEGGSVLSEDDPERERHDKLVRNILNQGQQIPMRQLFSLTEYPDRVMCLYAQGYSMCDYLVKRSSRQHLLNFVASGMQQGWDQAVKAHYGHNSVEELEQAWLKHLRDSKKQAQNQMVAQNPNPNSNSNTNSSFPTAISKNIVRMTNPPVPPLDPQPTVRGAMPTSGQVGQAFGPTNWQPSVQLQAPVPLTPTIPAQPQVYLPTGNVQLGMPRQ